MRGFPLNGIFGTCAWLLAGGCGVWHLLARRRRRRRHSSILQVDIQTKVRKIQELLKNSDFGKMLFSFIARHCAENFDARLAGIVIWSDCPLLEKKSRKASNLWKSTKFTIHVLKNNGGAISQKQNTTGGGGASFSRKKHDRWWNDTTISKISTCFNKCWLFKF